MKKIFSMLSIFIIVTVSFISCNGAPDPTESSSTESSGASELNAPTITIKGIEEAIKQIDPGFTFDSKPLFSMIGAVDGWMGYCNDEVVKIYEYSDDENYKEALETSSVIADWPKNGNFILETSNEDVIAVFTNFDGSIDSSTFSQEAEAETIVLENTYTIPDLCEFLIHRASFTYDVLPDSMENLYSHYEAEEGKIYLDIDIDIKNLQKSSVSCDNILNITLDYNDGYIYTAFPVVEDQTTGFTYANISSIDPLETKKMRYLVDCPIEVYTSDKPLSMIIEAEESKFYMALRPGNIAVNKANFTDEQEEIITSELSSVGIHPILIENGPPMSQDGISDDIKPLYAELKKYFVHSEDGKVYVIFFHERYNMIVQMFESDEGTLVIDNLEKVVNRYVTERSASTQSYTPSEPVPFSGEDIVYYHDVSKDPGYSQPNTIFFNGQ